MSGPAKPSGRQAADQRSAPRQEMWVAIKSTPERVTVTDLALATGVNRTSILRYLKSLTVAGYLNYTPPSPGHAGVWALIRDVGHHAPRVRQDGSKVTHGEAYAQLWRGMYMLKDFNFQDLVQSASIEISENTAKDYCKRLLAAGYLRVLRKADPHKAQIALYRLIRHSGPKAPQVQRVRQVFDPNSGQVYAVLS